MILPIVKYGHPALRAKGRKIEKIDDRILTLADDLFETMVEASGIGLAAQQVGMPLQICVVDITGIDDRPSWMRVDGETVDPEDYMPMILINPEVEQLGDDATLSEGCLSFPGILGEVERPAEVRVSALDLEGRPFEFRAGGLLARAIQHENDHLNGILFIDRMVPEDREACRADVDKLMRQTTGG